jgi:predicted XRE-type DNA-binding protein
MGEKQTTASDFRRLFAAWVRHHASEKSLSDTVIADALGVSQSSFNKLKNGNRTAKFEEAAILSHLFSAELPIDLKLANQRPVRKLIALRQNVAADVWRRKETIMLTAKLSVLQFPNEKYDNLDQFAHFVEDEHANGYVPKNFYIVCVNYSDARRAPLHGDMVVIERHRLFAPEEGGDLIEASIRRLAKRGDRWLLESVSSNPTRYPEIVYGGDSSQLKITGLIIARYAPD